MKLEEPEPFQPEFSKPGPKPKKGKTKEEHEHLNWVASLGCIICGANANVHHIRIVGEPRDHFRTIPLCYFHHQGEMGIHFLGKSTWRSWFGHEIDYLEKVNKLKRSL